MIILDLYLSEYRHPVWTTDIFSVTILRENRLNDIRSREVIAENLIHDGGNALEDIAVRNPLVVKSG